MALQPDPIVDIHGIREFLRTNEKFGLSIGVAGETPTSAATKIMQVDPGTMKDAARVLMELYGILGSSIMNPLVQQIIDGTLVVRPEFSNVINFTKLV
jgi:hypothetical protein